MRIELNHLKALNEYKEITAFYTSSNVFAWKYGRDGAAENLKELSSGLGISPDDIVMLNQTHTNGVRIVTKEDGGEMVTRPCTKEGYDGMITNEKGLLLCTLEADCVPVYLYDPLRSVIGMVHSGWRGTVGQIGPNAVKLMIDTYGCDPADIIAVFGPCICGECYDVGDELMDEFAAQYSEEELKLIFKRKLMVSGENKLHLDQKTAIRFSMLRCGLLPENIRDTGRCTKESADLCSWRRDMPVMKSMLTGIIIND